MYMATCVGCKLRDDCEHRDFMRKFLRGTGITSVKFVCKMRETIFKPGQPVIFKTFVSDDDGDRHYGSRAVEYPGYCIEQIGTKVFGFIKPGEPDIGGFEDFVPASNGFVKIPISRVRVDESRASITIHQCEWCGAFSSIGAPCWKNNYTPSGQCLADAGKEG